MSDAGRAETEAKRIERLVEVAANENLLCCVKVYCDWMRINPHIIATCAKVRIPTQTNPTDCIVSCYRSCPSVCLFVI